MTNKDVINSIYLIKGNGSIDLYTTKIVIHEKQLLGGVETSQTILFCDVINIQKHKRKLNSSPIISIKTQKENCSFFTRSDIDDVFTAIKKQYERYLFIKRSLDLKRSMSSLAIEIKKPKKAPILCVESGLSKALNKSKYYVWINSQNSLELFPVWNENKITVYELDRLNYFIQNVKRIMLPLNNIEYFRIQGELFRETKISGGGGGNISVHGALIGAALAGEAGAIIGGRKKIEEVNSHTITHDERKVVLSYLKNDVRYSYVFNYDAYQAFEDLMPEKSYNIVTELKKEKLMKINEPMTSMKLVTEQIRELAKLMDDGILTKEEFESKKQELLSKI